MLFCMQFGFYPDATFALACYNNGEEGEIAKWAVAAGRKERLHGVPGEPLSFAFSPNGEFILLTFRQGNRNASELRSSVDFKRLRRLEGEITYITSVDRPSSSFSKDSRQVLTVCGRGVPKIWDTLSGGCLHSLRPLLGIGSFAGFVPGHNRRVATFSALTGTVEVWNSTTGDCSFTLAAQGPLSRPPAYSPIGDLALSWGRSSPQAPAPASVCLWRTDSGDVLRTLQRHGIAYSSSYATFSCGGAFIIADKNRCLLFQPDGELARSFDLDPGISRFVRFLPDTTALAEDGEGLVDQVAP